MPQSQCTCGTLLEFGEHQWGQIVQCSSCGMHLQLPAPPTPPQPFPQPNSLPTAPIVAKHPPMPARSSKAGVWITVGVVTVMLVLLICGGLWLKWKVEQTVKSVADHVEGWANLVNNVDDLANLDEIVAEYKKKGYKHISAQVHVVDKPLTGNYIFTCQALEVRSEIRGNVVVLSQAMIVKGRIDGNVHLLGQGIVVERGAVITGDVHSRLAQLISIEGVIEGKLTGAFQALVGKRSNIKGGVHGAKSTGEAVSSAFDKVKSAIKKFSGDPKKKKE